MSSFERSLGKVSKGSQVVTEDLADLAISTAKIANTAVTTAKIATNNIDETLLKDALIADFSEVVVAAGDSFLLGDVGDSGNTKRDTIQGILDLSLPTKEFFVLMAAAEGAFPYNLGVGRFRAKALTASESADFNFFIPNDFTTLTDAGVIMIPDATETIQWDVDTDFGAVGEASTANQDSITDGQISATSGQLIEANVTTALTSIAANDYVGMNFASDTTSLRVVGLRVKYS